MKVLVARPATVEKALEAALNRKNSRNQLAPEPRIIEALEYVRDKQLPFLPIIDQYKLLDPVDLL